MGIHVHLDENANFEPEALRDMGRAFDKACIVLNVFAGDEHGRRIIATRIIDLAQSGMTDADTLANRVVAESRLAA